jgi:hypothetical protein
MIHLASFAAVVWTANPLFYHSLKRRLLFPTASSALHTWDALPWRGCIPEV